MFCFVFFFFCTVLSKPTILLHPKNISVYLEDEAMTVIFSCQAIGFPPPVISWVKNNSTISSGTVVQNGSISSLVLHLLKRKATPGKYKCVVKNPLGEASSSEGALVISTRPHSLGMKHICSNFELSLISTNIQLVLSAFLSLHLLACLPIVAQSCLSVSQSVGLSVSLSVCLPVCLSIALTISQ